MSTQKHETVFDLDALMTGITTSFVNAANRLQEACSETAWKEKHDYDYRMPQLKASVRLELSHSNGRIKGIFRKQQTESHEKLASTIELDLVAVPRGPEE